MRGSWHEAGGACKPRRRPTGAGQGRAPQRPRSPPVTDSAIFTGPLGSGVSASSAPPQGATPPCRSHAAGASDPMTGHRRKRRWGLWHGPLAVALAVGGVGLGAALHRPDLPGKKREPRVELILRDAPLAGLLDDLAEQLANFGRLVARAAHERGHLDASKATVQVGQPLPLPFVPGLKKNSAEELKFRGVHVRRHSHHACEERDRLRQVECDREEDDGKHRSVQQCFLGARTPVVEVHHSPRKAVRKQEQRGLQHTQHHQIGVVRSR
mmetsp:Transcript_22084/g.63208  ORF Transcript_22084/g.63208 Transcript_22084/m.63208 type:complete len:268 (-) Transcript_22084:1198-2001(-)